MPNRYICRLGRRYHFLGERWARSGCSTPAGAVVVVVVVVAFEVAADVGAAAAAAELVVVVVDGGQPDVASPFACAHNAALGLVGCTQEANGRGVDMGCRLGWAYCMRPATLLGGSADALAADWGPRTVGGNSP